MTVKWFMQRDNKEYGPYDLSQLEQFAREKTVDKRYGNIEGRNTEGRFFCVAPFLIV